MTSHGVPLNSLVIASGLRCVAWNGESETEVGEGWGNEGMTIPKLWAIRPS